MESFVILQAFSHQTGGTRKIICAKSREACKNAEIGEKDDMIIEEMLRNPDEVDRYELRLRIDRKRYLRRVAMLW